MMRLADTTARSHPATRRVPGAQVRPLQDHPENPLEVVVVIGAICPQVLASILVLMRQLAVEAAG